MKKFLKKISKVIIICIFAISNRFEDLLSDIQNEAQLKIIFTMKNLYYLRKAVCCKSLSPPLHPLTYEKYFYFGIMLFSIDIIFSK